MRYGFIQRLMWTGFKGTFRKQLSKSFGESNPAEVMKNARKKYREILSGVDEFEKGDRFLMNILSCAMLSAVLFSTEKKYSLEEVRVYYRRAMCGNFLMKAAAKKSRAYTAKGRELLKSQAKESEKNTNPYSWKFSESIYGDFPHLRSLLPYDKARIKGIHSGNVQFGLRHGRPEQHGVFQRIHACRRRKILRLSLQSYCYKLNSNDCQ